MKTILLIICIIIFTTCNHVKDEDVKNIPEANQYYWEGQGKMLEKDFEGAVKKFNFAIALFSSSKNYYARAKAKYQLGDYRGAIEDDSRAINETPKNHAIYFHRSNCKFQLNDFEGVIEDLDEAIELNPNFEVAYYNRGHAKFKLNLKEDACLDWSKAGELGYNDAYKSIKLYCK
jgi:tetratricopeptide (TPR) repeat protein